MQTLKDIWTRRFKLLKNKTWNGADPKTGFDLTKPIQADLPYTYENWNDLSISDFREILNNIREIEDTNNLEIDYYTTPCCTITIASNENITITAPSYYEQAQFTIQLKNATQTYSVSWYKHRGRIDSIINLTNGKPITLKELTDILVALKLEKPYEK